MTSTTVENNINVSNSSNEEVIEITGVTGATGPTGIVGRTHFLLERKVYKHIQKNKAQRKVIVKRGHKCNFR